MESKSILIVEDNQMNLKLIRDVLQNEGYQTLEAETGNAGVELVRERHPALILMDVNLPQMDGRAAMEILKADTSTRQIPIIAVTSFAMKGDREKLLAAGFDGYISKPLDIKDLLRVVESFVAGWVSINTNVASLTDKRQPRTVRPLTEPQARILIVDDKPKNIRLLEAFLMPGGHQVINASNGEEALQQVQQERPDLILLDLMMPIMDGYEVLKHLKADGRWRDIPVVMISALDDIKRVAQCIERGAEDYLPKPFDPVLLRARVSACLEKKRLRDQAKEYSDRLESELQAARDIQMSMVPTIFPPPEPTRPVEISATLEPARQVGGDLYDFFYTDEGQLCFLIGDVSDKGAPAALFMARTKGLVRLVADLLRTSDGGPPTPEQIITRVNDELCRDNGLQMFVTLLLGVLDPMSGALKCCNAGHLAPYVLGRNGVESLETAQGIPLGISASFGYDSTGWTLAPGDCLFIFTDGITEAMDSEGKLFGKKRLEEALQAVAREEPAKIVAAVIEKISEFTDAVPQADDIAAMALRYGL